jgi:hypothetical protein
MECIQQANKVQNFYLEIKVRYLKQNGIAQRQWFANNVCVGANNCKQKYDEVIITFTHIDDDNPEFFLQPGQVIKVLEGKVKQSKYGAFPEFFLDIDSFRQTNEEEKSKINFV